MKEEIYKGYKITVDDYMGPTNKFYTIHDPLGEKIVNTLWNDDKMWSTDEQAIASAKRCIDNPNDSYISLFNIK